MRNRFLAFMLPPVFGYFFPGIGTKWGLMFPTETDELWVDVFVVPCLMLMRFSRFHCIGKKGTIPLY